MKNRFLALAAVALTLGACSSDDESSVDYSKLTRKWYFVAEKVEGETIPYEDHEPCGKDYVEFMSGGMFQYVDVFDCTGNEPLTDNYEGTWTREGNTLTVMLFGEPGEIQIKKLNSSSMEISEVYDYDGDGDEETVVSTFTSTP